MAIKLDHGEQEALDNILLMTPAKFENFVDCGDHSPNDTVAIYKHMKNLEAALEAACVAATSGGCPAQFLDDRTPYPESCNVKLDAEGDMVSCRCFITDEEKDCWKKYFMGELMS